MSLFSRSLYILFSPRLPTFTPEDVAITAEYFNRLARGHEANMDAPRLGRGRISMHLAVSTRAFHPAVEMPPKFLRRVARIFWRDLLGYKWKIVLQK